MYSFVCNLLGQRDSVVENLSTAEWPSLSGTYWYIIHMINTSSLHSTIPNLYPQLLRNHQKIFDKFGNQLGYKSLLDWYDVIPSDIVKCVGKSVLNRHYNGSPQYALSII